MYETCENGYKESIKIAKEHYENFPVISLLFPRNLKKHVAIIYRFARQADDIADEGELTDSERIHKLNIYEEQFISAINGHPINSFWSSLNYTVQSHKLSPLHFTNLIKAFRQDILKKDMIISTKYLNIVSTLQILLED